MIASMLLIVYAYSEDIELKKKERGRLLGL
jgi:hypothetical protein